MTTRTWVYIGLLMALMSFTVVSAVFETPLAESTVDWFSFIAGGFLFAEGVYKIRKFKTDAFSLQICRLLRIFIGANVFLVHLAELLWGPHAPAQTSALLGCVIDWAAFAYGIFLMAEGLIRIATSEYSNRFGQTGLDKPVWMDQSTRVLRVAIGSCVVTIHVLQFMRA